MTTPKRPAAGHEVGAAAAALAMPTRGFVTGAPGETWEEGLLTGNGMIGANALGHPLDETIILSHHAMFLPMGVPIAPPDSSSRLFEVRGLIDRALYKQAIQPARVFSFSLSDGRIDPSEDG